MLCGVQSSPTAMLCACVAVRKWLLQQRAPYWHASSTHTCWRAIEWADMIVACVGTSVLSLPCERACRQRKFVLPAGSTHLPFKAKCQSCWCRCRCAVQPLDTTI